jgi:glycosyltransferase involved in cell wall biosynthesis
MAWLFVRKADKNIDWKMEWFEKNKLIFTIVVANYNNGKYLVELVDSMLSQNYPFWELIIVDDCSTDKSEQIIHNLPKDNRIKPIFHTQNKGAGATFDDGIRVAQGQIVAMLGADDALRVDALEIMEEAFRDKPKNFVIYTSFLYCDETMRPMEKKHFARQIEHKEQLMLHRNGCITGLVAFYKEFYIKSGGINHFFKRAIDQDCYLKLEEAGAQFVYLDKPIYLYRQHPKGISQGDTEPAQLFHLQAIIQAYQRRKKNKQVYNLSKKQYLNVKAEYYRRSAVRHITKHKLNFLHNIWLSAYYKPSQIFELFFWQWHLINLGLNTGLGTKLKKLFK